ncbi:MAG: DUF4080 domain-containing protein [Lachnospiraceae bacterium]|nr:DUF4080 domain-containing protein [Lachnospiraceae bacterium]
MKENKILLVAVNAKYIHSNLAVYSLRAFAQTHSKWNSKAHSEKNGLYKTELLEVTINNYVPDILREIYLRQPTVIAFSCYIWNIEIIRQLVRELNKVLPEVPIWLGGPEVSYNPKEQLLMDKELPVKGIMVGEGEVTFTRLVDYYNALEMGEATTLSDIPGIVYLENNEIVDNGMGIAPDMDQLEFPYWNIIDDFENKIIYYETSRGCPYRCSYCLSSIEKGIRIRSFSIVEKELAFFLAHKIPQVKFIDRTFNAIHEHAMAIWTYIKEHDNGVTNFHFEISADLLQEDEMELLNSMRPGLVQLEIGVQSVLPETIEAIHRKMDLSKLSYAVNKVNSGKNIHQHLDLIAGLPYEDYAKFQESFNYVYALRPEQLQLGFLKMLKGAGIYEEQDKYQIKFSSMAPYEVLSTQWLSYGDILELKKVEEMVEVYYNSGQFGYVIGYLEHHFDTPFQLYKELGDYYQEKGFRLLKHNRYSRYEIIMQFAKERLRQTKEQEELMEQLVVYDLYARENMKNHPPIGADMEQWKKEVHLFYQDERKMEQYLPNYKKYTGKQAERMTHMEYFTYDLQAATKNGQCVPKESFLLFDYEQRNPLNKEARTVLLTEDEFRTL